MSTADPARDAPTLRTWFSAPLVNRLLQMRRRRRRLTSVVGHTVRMSGLLLGGAIFFGSLDIVILLASAHGGEVATALSPELVAGVIALPVTLVLVGTVLVSGRKRAVLLVRRFGYRALSERIRLSLEASLRWHYRLVALDDSTLPSIGVASRHFRRAVVLVLGVTACVLLALGALLLYLKTASPKGAFDTWEAAAAPWCC